MGRGYPRGAEDLLSALGDRYARAILLMIMAKPMSPLELSRVLGIPQATVYRKLKMLEELGLAVKAGHTLSPATMRWSCRYRALLREAVIRVSPGAVKVEVKKL